MGSVSEKKKLCKTTSNKENQISRRRRSTRNIKFPQCSCNCELRKTVIENSSPERLSKKKTAQLKLIPNKSLPKVETKNKLNRKVTLRHSPRLNNNNKTTKIIVEETLVQELQEQIAEDNVKLNKVAKPGSSENIKLTNKRTIKNTMKNGVQFKQNVANNTHTHFKEVKLRKRKTMNYAESSLEASPNIHSNISRKKVPIYKQPVSNEIKLKRHRDTYEFDSDSETKKKRKKCKHNDSSGDEYNRTIQNILWNVMSKVKKKNKKKNNFKHLKPVVSQKKNNIEESKSIIKNPSKLNNIETKKNVTTKNMTAVEEPLVGNDITDSDDHNVDDMWFDFEKTEPSKKQPPKIKILSNIQLQPNKELNLSIATPTKFRESKPNANSTMLNNVLTPWRFNEINIKRNPHFITLKESSLPCISQDMVLDHTIVDKLGDSSKTEMTDIPQKGTDSRKRTLTQKNLTDYFDSNNENKENYKNKESSQVSLFDSDQLSPIKGKNGFGNKVGMVRRKVLGERNDNFTISQPYISTPKQNVTSLVEAEKSDESLTNHFAAQDVQKSNKDFTNFGFSSSDEESEDQSNAKKSNDNKPFRLRVNMNDKKYGKQKLMNTKKAESIVASDEESDVNCLSDLENNSEEVKLFEDFHDTYDEDRFQEPKRTKNKKLKWLNKEDKDIQKHKNRKDIMTKEEEMEAEKWATAFNSMCKEIEEFPLEIE